MTVDEEDRFNHRTWAMSLAVDLHAAALKGGHWECLPIADTADAIFDWVTEIAPAPEQEPGEDKKW